MPRALFPPLAGELETTDFVFYGGLRMWDARVGTTNVVVGVARAFRNRPEEGSAWLFVIVTDTPT